MDQDAAIRQAEQKLMSKPNVTGSASANLHLYAALAEKERRLGSPL